VWRARLDVAVREQQALLAKLRRIERQRADLIAEALDLAAANPRGAELADRIERLVEGLLALDLRPPDVRLSDGSSPDDWMTDPPTEAIDVVLLADADITRVEWVLALLASRTPRLATVHVVEAAGGASVAELGAIIGEDPARFVIPGMEATRAGGPLGVAAALSLGASPFVAVLSARVTVANGWSDALAARLDADPRLGAVVPLVHGGSSATAIELPPADRLGTEGAALVAALTAGRELDEVDSADAPCVVLRRAALAAAGPGAGTPERPLAEVASALHHDGWRVAAAPEVLVTLETPEGDGGHSGRLGRSPLPPWRSRPMDLAEEVASLPAALAAAIGRLHEPIEAAYVVSASGGAGWQAAAIEVAGLRACGVPARVIVIGTPSSRRLPAEDAQVVERTGLAEALAGAEVVVAGDPATADVVGRVAERLDLPHAVLVHGVVARDLPPGMTLLAGSTAIWDRLEGLRDRAIALPPVFDDSLFRPLSDDAGDVQARISIVGTLRPSTADRMLRCLDQISARLGDACVISTIGRRTDVLLDAGLVEGPWQERHLGSAKGLDLARAFNRADIFLEMETQDLSGRTSLAAMACGAVAILPRDLISLELSSGGRDAVLVGQEEPEAWSEAVCAVAENWTRLRALRARSLEVARSHGLVAAGASRYQALRTFVRRPVRSG
jgi:hypothetical protein